jgi:hypothetical protein
MAGRPLTLTTKLSAIERSDLKRCERIIKRGSTVFIQVSEALMEIRDKRLYRENYPTFDGYCQDKWGFTARHGQRLLAAKDVVDNLRPTGRIPDNERQARPLVGLPAETQREVWQEAIESADDGKITAERVAEIAEVHKIESPAPASTPEPAASPDWAALLQPQAFYLTHPHERVVYQTPYFNHWEAGRAAPKGIIPQRGAYIIKAVNIFGDYRFEKLVRPNDSTPQPAIPLTAAAAPAPEGQASPVAALDDSNSPDLPESRRVDLTTGEIIMDDPIPVAASDTPRHDPRAVSNAGEWTPGDTAYLNRAQSAVNHAHPGKMPFVGHSVDEVARLKARVAELEAENARLVAENIRLRGEVVNLRNLAELPDVKQPPVERTHW